MGIFDKAKEMLGQHPDQVDAGLDKAADFADEKTGNKYSEQIGQGAEMAKDHLGAPDAPVVPPTETEHPA